MVRQGIARSAARRHRGPGDQRREPRTGLRLSPGDGHGWRRGRSASGGDLARVALPALQVRIGTGGLRSTSVTQLHHYYTPIRHPRQPTPPLTRSSLPDCPPSTTTDFPCCTNDLSPCVLPPLPRWMRCLRFSLTWSPPSAFLVIVASRHPRRRFEACSVFTHVAARMACWPPTRPFQEVLQPICYLLDRPLCFRPERELARSDWARPRPRRHRRINRALARHTQQPRRAADQAVGNGLLIVPHLFKCLKTLASACCRRRDMGDLFGRRPR